MSHSGDKPILFLPSRDTTPGIPDGWHTVIANGKEYSANFVKVAINVMTSSANEENQLPDVIRGWFGHDAGQPGRSERVIFDLHDSVYHLEPIAVKISGPELWHEYIRADIPPCWDIPFSTSRWQQGYVKIDQHIFLLVTLEKKGMQVAHQYDDKFLSPDTFQWVSQNRQSINRPSGQIIKDHKSKGYTVHLFVRKKSKKPNNTAMEFTYCGDVSFIEWEGSEPITVRWKLESPLPKHLHKPFGLV